MGEEIFGSTLSLTCLICNDVGSSRAAMENLLISPAGCHSNSLKTAVLKANFLRSAVLGDMKKVLVKV